mgnify:CR=1 FL=1
MQTSLSSLEAPNSGLTLSLSIRPQRIVREVKERLARHPIYGDVKSVFFHRNFPVDPRHNAKIDREALAEWAEKQKEVKEG